MLPDPHGTVETFEKLFSCLKSDEGRLKISSEPYNEQFLLYYGIYRTTGA